MIRMTTTATLAMTMNASHTMPMVSGVMPAKYSMIAIVTIAVMSKKMSFMATRVPMNNAWMAAAATKPPPIQAPTVATSAKNQYR